jgi:putative ABC transport system permease protein
MRIALRELRRRPGRFTVATAALAFLALLLLFLGALLDGLFLGSTGAIRAQRGDVIVYSATSRDSFLRSRLSPETRASVDAVAGVERVGGLGVALTTAVVPGADDLADVAVIGYELAPSGVPATPAAGEAWADERLRASGVRTGQQLRVGIGSTPVTVVGFVEDTNYLLQGALWVAPDTWRSVANAVPDLFVPPGVFQALVVQAADGTDAGELVRAIDAGTGGVTSSLTKPDAELSLPGTKEQRSTFNGIIGTTFGVAVLVVALFFALLTLERVPLYGVLKAMGSSARQLFAGVVAQAIIVAVIAFSIGLAVLGALSVIVPADFPFQITVSRVVTTAIGLVVAAVFGSLMSLRRVVRTDPASALAV